MPGSLKNAIDFLYHEWANKAAGFVCYGVTGGVRGVEHMRGIVGELQMADVRAHVTLSLFTDFENYTTFKPTPGASTHMPTMLDQLIAWSGALKGVREKQAAAKRPRPKGGLTPAYISAASFLPASRYFIGSMAAPSTRTS